MRHKNLYGLLGEKLSHSISPEIHEEIFRKLNIQGDYNIFEIKKQNIKKAIEGLKVLGFTGVNVTIPYKTDVMKELDVISKEAQDIGAVNTIYFKDDKAYGYNTDYYGFGMMLDNNNINIKGKNAVVLGTGGAAKGIVQYLKDKETFKILIVSRNPKDVLNEGAFKGCEVIDYEQLKYIEKGEIIVNCTPCGMYPKVGVSPVNKEVVAKFNAAVDLIYNPEETLFLKYAKEQNRKAVNGLYMLVGQAVKAEEIWNKCNIQSEVVDKIFSTVKNSCYDK